MINQAPTVTRALIDAYRGTHYCVTGVSEPFVLRIDEPSPDLGLCHDVFAAATSAIITAFNPHSTPTPDRVNDVAQQRLSATLDAGHWRYVDSLGVDPTGEWPAEPSLLVFGLTRLEAQALGQQFGQNAIVWATADAIPRLLMLR